MQWVPMLGCSSTTFNELRQVPGYTLSGLTGQLSAGPNCNVDRDMTWYQVQDSNVVPVAN